MLTFDVSKLDKSKESNSEQPENILFIFVTLDVLKLDKFNELNFEQLENIPTILLTWDESKLDKSISIIFLQSLNRLFVELGGVSHINVILLISFSELVKL